MPIGSKMSLQNLGFLRAISKLGPLPEFYNRFPQTRLSDLVFLIRKRRLSSQANPKQRGAFFQIPFRDVSQRRKLNDLINVFMSCDDFRLLYHRRYLTNWRENCECDSTKTEVKEWSAEDDGWCHLRVNQIVE